jgi:hypothetical protein
VELKLSFFLKLKVGYNRDFFRYKSSCNEIFLVASRAAMRIFQLQVKLQLDFSQRLCLDYKTVG